METLSEVVVDQHEFDWPKVVRRFGRDRILFLENLVGLARREIDLTGRSALVFDGRLGCTSLYLPRSGCSVTCCVPGAGEGADLTTILNQEGVENVSVLLQAKALPHGPMLFPFVERRFDAAIIAVGGTLTSSTQNVLRETAHALGSRGQLALIAWMHPMPLKPKDQASTAADRRALSIRRDWAPPFVDSLRGAGFKNAVTHLVRIACVAPSYEEYMTLMLSMVSRTPQALGPRALALLDNPEGPVPLEVWGAIIVADAPDVPITSS